MDAPLVTELDESGERVVVIVPHAPDAPGRPAPRVVGPGRRELAYLARVAELEREVDLASLVERGSTRRLDRMEGALDEKRREAEALAQREKRMILALGALQRENEILHERLALASRPRPALERARAPARKHARGFWSKLFTARHDDA
jgi:hypothetical protein